MRTTATFADRLKEALRDSGKRAVDVYQAIGVSKQAFYNWTGGRESVPEPQTCFALAVELGVAPDWLTTGKGQKKAVQLRFSQEQIDIAEAWPHLPPALREQIAVLIRHAAAQISPQLKPSLSDVDRDLQERANRILEEAQNTARKKPP